VSVPASKDQEKLLPKKEGKRKVHPTKVNFTGCKDGKAFIYDPGQHTGARKRRIMEKKGGQKNMSSRCPRGTREDRLRLAHQWGKKKTAARSA